MSNFVLGRVCGASYCSVVARNDRRAQGHQRPRPHPTPPVGRFSARPPLERQGGPGGPSTESPGPGASWQEGGCPCRSPRAGAGLTCGPRWAEPGASPADARPCARPSAALSSPRREAILTQFARKPRPSPTPPPDPRLRPPPPGPREAAPPPAPRLRPLPPGPPRLAALLPAALVAPGFQPPSGGRPGRQPSREGVPAAGGVRGKSGVPSGTRSSVPAVAGARPSPARPWLRGSGRPGGCPLGSARGLRPRGRAGFEVPPPRAGACSGFPRGQAASAW